MAGRVSQKEASNADLVRGSGTVSIRSTQEFGADWLNAAGANQIAVTARREAGEDARRNTGPDAL